MYVRALRPGANPELATILMCASCHSADATPRAESHASIAGLASVAIVSNNKMNTICEAPEVEGDA